MFLLKIIVLFFTTLCIIKPNITDGFTEEETLSFLRGEEGQYICPGTSFCQTNQTGMGQPQNKCCKDCSCSEDCEVNNTCCFREWIGAEYKTCVETALLETFTLTPAYYMMTKCSLGNDNTTNDGEHIDCSEFHESSPWGSLNPVYSEQTNIIYLNLLCAKCNGLRTIEQLHSFNLKVDCYFPERLELAMLVSEIVSFIKYRSSTCTITVNGPEVIGSIISSKLCLEHKNISETCSPYKTPLAPILASTNMTYDVADKLCKSNYFSPFIDPQSRIYKNIFCFLCAGGFWIVHAQCSSLQDLFQKSSLFSFSVFLSLAEVAQLQTNASSEDTFRIACLVENNIKNDSDCKHVFCPMGRVYTAHSRCVFISKYFSLPRLSIFVKITLKSPLVRPYDNNSISYISKTPKLQEKPFNVWKVKETFYSIKQTSHDVVEIKYLALLMEYETTGLMHDHIIYEIEDFLSKDVNIVVDKTKLLGSVEIFPISFEQFTSEFDRDFWKKLNHQNVLSRGQFALAEYHFCDLIQFCDHEISKKDTRGYPTVVIEQTGMIVQDYQFKYVYVGDTRCVRVCIHHTRYHIQANGSSHEILMILQFISLWHVIFRILHVIVSF